jgi:hypothetical protein
MNLLTTKITNPLDDLFNTLPNDMEQDGEFIPMTEGTLASLNGEEAPPEKDAEDIEIDEKIDTVYTAAIDAFNTQTAVRSTERRSRCELPEHRAERSFSPGEGEGRSEEERSVRSVHEQQDERRCCRLSRGHHEDARSRCGDEEGLT